MGIKKPRQKARLHVLGQGHKAKLYMREHLRGL